MKKWLMIVLALCLLAFSACGREEAVTQPTLSQKPNPNTTTYDWGVTMTAEDITPVGCTVVIRQNGGNPTGELIFGEDFWVEIQTASGWMEFPATKIPDWVAVGYFLPKENETQWECTWEWLYGALPQGTYRIGKDIMDSRAPGDYDQQDHYTEPFTIQ